MTAVEQLANEPVLLRDTLEDGIVRLTLNRPKAANSLSHDLVHSLHAAFLDLANDETVRVVILAGAGKNFCAGHDLTESIAAAKDPASKREANIAASAMIMAINRCPKPVIARIQGVATAAGCQLAASCDLVFATTEARFATPGVNIGLWCLAPQVAVSRAIAPKHAMQMLLTGKMIDAATAVRFGLVNEAVAPDALDARLLEIAREIASKSAPAVAMGKESFYRQLEMDVPGAYAMVDELIYRAIQTDDAQEGISAFLEKRKPVWKGRNQ
ncbi:MAG: enoyl-CoA hydratase [Proteobacteria bacterium]|nr:enoyl-CoA hydratase [Pseudomonadota bacterium]MDA1059711.1 enoyl-CoA hydratase [Pseudomonadota bacterium]